MRSAFLILPFFFLPLPAAAAQCPGQGAPTIAVETVVAPVAQDRALPIAELNRRLAVTESNSYALGLTESDLQAKSGYTLVAVTQSGGGAPDGICVAFRKLEVILTLTVRVHLAAELKPGSCFYRTAAKHEQGHVDLEHALLPKAKARVAAALRSVAARVERGGSAETLQRKLQKAADAAVKRALNAYDAERKRKQQALDTPAEYAKVAEACRGEPFRPQAEAMADLQDDGPIAYIARTRDYYAALGYAPYRWAEHADAPFHRPAKPLALSRIALVTTASPVHSDSPRDRYDAAAKFLAVYSEPTDRDPDLRINHVAIDFTHTTAADPGSYFPLAALRRVASAGRIGGLAPRFHGVPTHRSQRHTMAVDGPDLLARVKQDGADGAVLVPNCPVCHQGLALMARLLEANGIATVVMGCARDIVAQVGVPRFLFSDFPLGNAAGKPGDPASQDLTLGLALDLLEQATAPRTIVQSPLRWRDDPSWKRDYGRIDGLTADDIARLKAEFEAQKHVARALR